MELELYYVDSNSSQKFEVIILKTKQKNSENLILAKGNNSSESMLNKTKVELDL